MTVLLCVDIQLETLRTLLNRFGLETHLVPNDEVLPGSFWKTPEAGLVANRIYIRDDTPVHSALHEACHYICMDQARRDGLDTDAGGGYEEENGVCYLQILLADFITELRRERMFSDMDAWGYSFRLGSAQAWFERDAEDAQAWLIRYGLIDNNDQPTWAIRERD